MNGEEISRALTRAGYISKVLYGSNQELVDNQVALQNGLATLFGKDGQPKNLRIKAVTEAVTEMAEESGVADSEELACFKRDMGSLGLNIGTNIGGIVGEKQGFRALRPLEHDRDTLVLHNVRLKAGEDATEVDAIVITTNGIFVIEIKNCKKPMVITPQGFFQGKKNPRYRYPLGERMGCKELLVRQCLGDDVDVPIHAVLLYVNDTSSLSDEFGRIQISYRNTIAYDIRAHRRDGRFLTPEQVRQAGESIEGHRLDAAFPSKIDLDAIVENFVALMRLIESAQSEKAKAEEERERSEKQRRGGRVVRSLVGILSIFAPHATRVA